MWLGALLLDFTPTLSGVTEFEPPNCLIYLCIVIAHLCINYSSRNPFTVLLSFSQFFSLSPWRLTAFPAKLCLARNVVGLHPVWVLSRCLVGCSVGLVLRGGWLDTPFGPGPQVHSVRYAPVLRSLIPTRCFYKIDRKYNC